MKRTITALGCACAAGAIVAAVPTIDTATVGLSQDENSRIVTVTYDLKDAPGIVTVDFLTNGVSIGAENFQNVWGDVNRRLEAGDGKKLFWPAGNDWPGHLIEEGTLSAVVTAWATNAPPPFVAIHAAVSNAAPAFYACEAAVPGCVTNDIYKTERILLKRVFAAGVKWRMGAPRWETNRGDRDVPHDVMLTNDYYLGVYPVTQRQFFLLAKGLGGISADHNNSSSGMPHFFGNRLDSPLRPAENMSWGDLRGNGGYMKDGSLVDGSYSWPRDGHAVNPGYFLGKLRKATGIMFDLPTEAQWEYACRAGSTDAYNVENASMDDLGWYTNNSAVVENGVAVCQTHPVGLKKPNAWGFYDMHGNVEEWCLDWFETIYTTRADGVPMLEPVGPASGAPSYARVQRGGAYNITAKWCRSAAEQYYKYSQNAQNAMIGFRLCCPVGVR